MKVLAAAPPPQRPDRHATALLHDEANARLVAFHLAPGQVVAPHSSPSTVALIVVNGSGTFRGGGDGALLGPGQVVIFEPGEEHGIEAGTEPLHFVAVIAPRPGG